MITQTYKSEDEHTKKIVRRELRKSKEEDFATGITDVYDLYDLASQVHSNAPHITRDFTLGKLNSDIIHAKLPKFIREQLKTILIIRDYIEPSHDELSLYYPNNTKEEITQKLLKIRIVADKTERLLLSEVYTMVITSRSAKGDVIHSILTHGRTKQETAEFEDELLTNGPDAEAKQKKAEQKKEKDNGNQ